MRRTISAAALLAVGAVLGALLAVAISLAGYGISNGRLFEVAILTVVAAAVTAITITAARRFIR